MCIRFIDTKYRVTGYSYQMNESHHRVVLMGRSHWKDSSEFANQSVYRLFDMVKEPYSTQPLVPVNDRKTLKAIANTFGPFADQYLRKHNINSDKISWHRLHSTVYEIR